MQREKQWRRERVYRESAEKQMEDRMKKEDCGSLFRQLSCHLHSYNASRARVTSGGIPALWVCVASLRAHAYV